MSIKSAATAIGALETALDLAIKLQSATDITNNVQMIFENRSISHVGTFKALENEAQDWEVITPYLGSTTLNKHTNSYEPSTAISITDVVDKQGLTLSLMVIENGALGPVAGTVEVTTHSTAGMLHGQISVKITNAKGTVIYNKEKARDSFADTITDIGHGPLMYSIGWAYNRYILQVTVSNMNLVF